MVDEYHGKAEAISAVKTVTSVGQLATRLKMLKSDGGSDCGKTVSPAFAAASTPHQAGQASRSSGPAEPGSLAMRSVVAKPAAK